ncbi:MAG: ABC transporter ATP-binding protein [Nitratireductor sp.]
MSLLAIEDLTVEFQTAGGLFKAVDQVSLVCEKREILSIVGESGSGKSVSMLALMGLLPWTAKVSAKRMEFDGKDMLAMDAKARREIIGRDMAMIFQEPMSSLNPCFTVGFQIKEMLRRHTGLDRKARHNRAIELMESVGIPSPQERLSVFPHQLSGGMSQRVMIAMATACRPKLLIADEPTTALDVTIQAQILDLLRSLRDEHDMGLILITHDMGVVAEMAERVQVQYAGQKVEEQEVGELFGNPHHPYTAALLSALPERAVSKKLPSIPGVVPGQYDRPPGCLFEPRCSHTTPECRSGARRQDAAMGQALCNNPLGKPAANARRKVGA